MILKDHPDISLDHTGLHIGQWPDTLNWNMMGKQQLDSFVVADVVAHAGGSMTGMASDVGFVQASFIQSDALVLTTARKS